VTTKSLKLEPTQSPHAAVLDRGGNALLASLSEQAFALLTPHLRYRKAHKGTTLWDTGSVADQIYFPQDGLISITVACRQGYCIEAGSVGREGAAGMHAASVHASVPTSAVVRIDGHFAVIAERAFREALRQSEEVATLAGLSVDWILRQAQLMAACNATHGAEARLCRWLLLAGMRAGVDMIPVTQEEMAGMLGIRRTTVTLLAKGLHDAGVIDYSRGKLVIRDHAALKKAACGCCPALDEEYWPATRQHRYHAETASVMPSPAG